MNQESIVRFNQPVPKNISLVSIDGDAPLSYSGESCSTQERGSRFARLARKEEQTLGKGKVACSIHAIGSSLRVWYRDCALRFQRREDVFESRHQLQKLIDRDGLCRYTRSIMPYADKERQNRYSVQWSARRREELLRENGPCKKCGSWDRLEVDHINPEQKVSHRIWRWKAETRLAELKKCQPLCYECHKKKSAEEKSRPAEHGTASCYRRGCRCEVCRKYQVDRMARYHAVHPRGKNLRSSSSG